MLKSLHLTIACCTMCLLLGGCMHHGRLQPYAGQWVLKSSGKNIMALNTKVQRGKIVGTLVSPQYFEEHANGEFEGISLPIMTKPVTGRWKGDTVELTVGRKPDWDKMPMTLPDKNHALLGWTYGKVPAWKFERTATGQNIVVATDWPVYDLSPEVVDIRQQLRTMAEEDQAARQKKWIDSKEIEQLSEKDKPELEAIYARYGWPKLSVFGAQASNDFWLLVQHQPLLLQKRMLSPMKAEVDAGEASKENYAYLFDRVQIGEGKPQHWGTQAKCDNGRAILSPIDGDAAQVEQARKEIGLDTLNESLKRSDAICAHVRNSISN